MSDKIKITLPKEFTKRIANRAVKHAQNDMARRGWSPNTVRNGIRPYFDDGKYGIATNEGYEYIKFQDRGFKPFLKAREFLLVTVLLPPKMLENPVLFVSRARMAVVTRMCGVIKSGGTLVWSLKIS